MKDIYEKYFLWNDFLKYVDWQKPNADTRSHDTDDDDWFGTHNFEDAMHLARYGWTEYMNQIKPTDTDCWDMLNNLQLWETKHSVVGSGVDIGRYVIGIPDCMSYQDSYLNDRFHATPKFVNVVVNVTYRCARDYEYVLERGLDIVSVINTLETNNVKTRIILLENCTWRGYLYRIFINIKDYQDIFYMEKLMFPIAHTSFLRRLIFSAEEREPKEIRELFGFENNCGYGQPSDRFEYDDKNTLYFGTEPLYEEDIKEWIQGVLEGDSEDYDGHSRLDKHLDKLQCRSGQISDDLKKYMQEKAERYKQVQQEKEQAERKAIEDAAERAKRIAEAEKQKSKSDGKGSTENAEQQPGQEQQRSGGKGSSSGSEESDKEEKSQGGKQKSDNKDSGSDQSKQNQQKSHNGIGMLPAIRQPSLPVPRTHYFPNKGGALVLPSHYAPQGSGPSCARICAYICADDARYSHQFLPVISPSKSEKPEETLSVYERTKRFFGEKPTEISR